MKTVVKATGEVLEFNPKNLTELVEAWTLCSEYEKAWKACKDKMKPLVEKYIQSNGTTEPVNGYMFRQTSIQRMNYDKATLREALDEDTFDLLLEPNKTAVDAYLKENLNELGPWSTKIRDSMVPVGKPYTVIRAERI